VATAPYVGQLDEFLKKRQAEQDQKVDRIVALTKPLFACVGQTAHAPTLISSPETADNVARAAVGLCSKEEAEYRKALYELAMVQANFDADGRAKQTHEHLVESALTIIVTERQRPRSSTPPAVARPRVDRGI
jgi:hypothetical protein